MPAIRVLEQKAPGGAFDPAFLRVFSMHHYDATKRLQIFLAGRDPDHQPLRRYCQAIVDSQTLQIEEMRELLCTQYSDCDFQPQARAER